MAALAWPRISAGQSRFRPSQSRGFWAKPGQANHYRHPAVKDNNLNTVTHWHVYDPANLPLHTHTESPISSTPPVLFKWLQQQHNQISLQRIQASKAFPFFHTFHPYFSLIPFPMISCTLSSRTL